jgi:hypothetical protein
MLTNLRVLNIFFQYYFYTFVYDTHVYAFMPPPHKSTSSSRRIRTYSTPPLLWPWQKSMRMKAVEKEPEKNELRFQQYVQGILTVQISFISLIILQLALLQRTTLPLRKLQLMTTTGCHAKMKEMMWPRQISQKVMMHMKCSEMISFCLRMSGTHTLISQLIVFSS